MAPQYCFKHSHLLVFEKMRQVEKGGICVKTRAVLHAKKDVTC